MTDELQEDPHPTAKEKGETSEAVSDLDQTIKAAEHAQSMKEREQRVRIGEKVAGIVIRLPLFIMALFWVFFVWLWFCSPDRVEKISTLLAVMFSVTHLSAVALYYSLLRGMFQKIGEDKDDKPSLNVMVEGASAGKDIAQG